MAVLIPAAAEAKSYALTDANVAVRISSDGTLLVAERISFLYDGIFSGAYRDIPLRSGESTRKSPPNDQNAWPPSDASGS